MIKTMVVSGVCALAVLCGAIPGAHARRCLGTKPVSQSWTSSAPVYGDVQVVFGQNIDVGKGVTDLLVGLVKDGSYSD
jgi:hypothetical protein